MRSLAVVLFFLVGPMAAADSMSDSDEAMRTLYESRITASAVIANCLNGVAEKFKGKPAAFVEEVRANCGKEAVSSLEREKIERHLTSKALALLEASHVLPAAKAE